jgi:hypothetical protein
MMILLNIIPGRRKQEKFMHKIRIIYEGHIIVGEWQGNGMVL